MILRQAKNPQSGRACAPGGSARQGAGDPPPDGRIVEFLIAVGREAPCEPNGRLRGRCARGGWGSGGGSPSQPQCWWQRRDLLVRRRQARARCFNLWLRCGGYEVLCAGTQEGAGISQGLWNFGDGRRYAVTENTQIFGTILYQGNIR